MSVTVKEIECHDVAQLLNYAADRQDLPFEYSRLMKRGESLLFQLSALCKMLTTQKEDAKNVDTV